MTTVRPATGLTGREVEVIHRLAQGNAPCDLARSLGLSAHTIKDHLTSARRKLGVSSSPALVHAAFLNGALTPPQRIAGASPLNAEREVYLRAIAAGQTQRQMAARTYRSTSVVGREVKKLLNMLNALSEEHAVTKAWRLGLLGAHERSNGNQ